MLREMSSLTGVSRKEYGAPMSEEVIMKDFKKKSTELIVLSTDQQLRALKIKINTELERRITEAEKKYYKGGYTLNKPSYKS